MTGRTWHRVFVGIAVVALALTACGPLRIDGVQSTGGRGIPAPAATP